MDITISDVDNSGLMNTQTQEQTNSDELVDTFSKGVIFQASSFGLSKIFGMVFTILILNYFVAQESDLFFSANAFAMLIASFAGLGLSVGAIKFIPGFALKKDGESIKKQIASSVALLCICVVIIFCISWIISPYVEELNKQFEQSLQLIFLVFLLSLVIIVTSYLQSALNALKQFFTTSFTQVAIQILRVVVILVLIYVGLTFAFEMFAGYVVTYALVCVYLTWTVYKKIGKMSGEWKIDFSSLKKNIQFGFPLYIAGTMDTLLTQMDIVIIALFLGDNPGMVSGYVAVALIVRNIAPMIAAPISAVQQPILVEEHDKKSEDMFHKVVKQTSRLSLYVGLMVLLVFLAFDKALLGLVAKDYVENAYMIWLFAPFVIAVLFGVSSRNALMARGHVKTLFLLSLIIATINILLDVWLIPTIGIAGAAIGSSVAIVVGEIMAIYFANRKFGAAVHPDTIKALLAFVITLLVCFVPLPYITTLADFSAGGVISLIISMSTACSAYLIVLFLIGGFRRQDIEMGHKFLQNNKLAFVSDILRPYTSAVADMFGMK
jgi:O-antigen/teichoic acid export membrane protein